MSNYIIKALRKQNKRFATIATKQYKPRKKKESGKEVQQVNIAVYYVIFWLIIAYLSFNTLF